MYTYSELIAFGGIPERKQLDTPEQWTIINLSKTRISENGTEIHIPLNDGSYDGGNNQQEFANAVNTVRKEIQSKNQIFVHCAIGQSRSVSVLATAIAAEEHKEYSEVQKELMKIRNSFTKPVNSLRKKAELYLRHNTN
jgi:atypical dual specificity phosphatase